MRYGSSALAAVLCAAAIISASGALAAGVVSPGIECAQLKPGASLVEVEVYMPEPRFDAGFSAQDILAGKAATAAANVATKDNLRIAWTHTDPQTQAFNTVMWDVQTNFVTQTQPVDQFKTRFCPYVMEAAVDILALSMISVPRESPPGTCKGEEIAAHEYKHFEVNKYLLDQAVQKLRRDMPRIIRDLEMEGYVPEAEAQGRIDAMKLAMTEAVSTYLAEEVARRMTAMNSQTDSPEEYARMDKLVTLCEIKDAMAKGDKAKALEKMRAFKAGNAAPAQ